jgi:hypothetical protein
LGIAAAEPRLKCDSGDYYIEPLAAVGAMTDNHWGWARDDGLTPNLPNSWTGVTSSPATIKNFSTATDLSDGDDTRIWLGAQADLTLPACVYQGEITITATANL